MEDLAVIYGDRIEDTENLLTRLQNTASRRFEGFLENWSTQGKGPRRAAEKKNTYDDARHS